MVDNDSQLAPSVLSESEKLPSIAIIPPVRDEQGRFLTGNKGGGRKVGTRNKFSEVFIRTLVEDFQTYGQQALSKLRAENPEAYLRILASLLPRGAVAKFEQGFDIDFSTITQEELVQLLDDVQRRQFIENTIKSLDNS
jgi:hypothetical protein